MSSLVRRLLLLAACFACASLSFAQNDDIVRDFKKYYAKFKDAPTRAEAVLSLKGSEGAAVVDVLVPILKDPEPVIVRAAVEVLSSFASPESVNALLAAYDKVPAPEQRGAILRAIRDAKYSVPPATLLAALGDKDWGVRRFAIQAAQVIALQDPAVQDKLALLCRDPEPAVRGQAIDALTLAKSELVIAPAIAVLNDSVWQVRQSAIAALKTIRRTESVRPLIERMQVEEGRLVEDISLALRNLTGREFGMDPPTWKAFIAQYKDGSYQIPTEDGLKYLLAKREATTGKSKYAIEGQPPPVSYHGIETPSKRILFVIDQSGSMETEVVERERYKDGGYPSMMRIDIVKVELQRTIERLEPYVQFNILAFATGLDPWKKNLVAANLINKQAAMEWVGRLEPLGGNSKSDLVEAGLGGSANVGAGKTNTFGALMWSLNSMGPRTKDAFSKSYQVEADTVFFLSDGRPTVGDFVETDDILREFKAANELRKMVVHTLAIGEFEKDFMKKLAESSGGVFVDLGH